MPSPFPGMNPYLEQEDVWHDFHERLVTIAAEMLETQVGPDYIVKIDAHIYVHELPPGERTLLGGANVSVSGPSRGQARKAPAALLEAPLTLRLPAVDVESLSFIEIRDRRGRELVAVVEVLSPTNKRPGPHREQYLAKRAQLLSSPAHFVEIDLLRGDRRLPLADLPPCDYYVLVSRLQDRPQCGVWALGLKDRLPVVPVPLRAPDGEATLNLKHALDRAYDAAGYVKYIYGSQPTPPLTGEELVWARAFVPAPDAGGRLPG
jgi:hypothetical protein